jgi:hypothetical protein
LAEILPLISNAKLASGFILLIPTLPFNKDNVGCVFVILDEKKLLVNALISTPG